MDVRTQFSNLLEPTAQLIDSTRRIGFLLSLLSLGFPLVSPGLSLRTGLVLLWVGGSQAVFPIETLSVTCLCLVLGSLFFFHGRGQTRCLGFSFSWRRLTQWCATGGLVGRRGCRGQRMVIVRHQSCDCATAVRPRLIATTLWYRWSALKQPSLWCRLRGKTLRSRSCSTR